MHHRPVTIIGSHNVGLFIKSKCLPQEGEAVIDNEFYEGAGGKGSNQGICVAKMSIKVYLLLL